MFLLAAEGGHHTPLIVEFINEHFGKPVHAFQMEYTHPMWKRILEPLGTTPEAVFGGAYTPENAIPWYTIMFVIACILSVVVIWIFKGKLSSEDPTHGQLTLEAGFLALKEMIVNVVGNHGLKYFPVVATFASASTSARLATSRSPRLKPWPAIGCNACAALPMTARRSAVCSAARVNDNG